MLILAYISLSHHAFRLYAVLCLCKCCMILDENITIYNRTSSHYACVPRKNFLAHIPLCTMVFKSDIPYMLLLTPNFGKRTREFEVSKKAALLKDRLIEIDIGSAKSEDQLIEISVKWPIRIHIGNS